MNQNDDKEIVEGCKKGKRNFQNLLYSNYSSLLFGVCLRYIKNRTEAEDVLHDSFIKIYINIKNFNFSNKATFISWMKRVTANTAINYLRDNNHFRFNLDIEDVDFAEDEVVENESNEDIDMANLMRIIQELPQGYGTVFNLYIFEKYSHQEIAEILKISVNTSKTQLLKARKYIKNKMVESNKEIAFSN
jgi:RNA polymerase sigma-70 factor (ECF subfamily)